MTKAWAGPASGNQGPELARADARAGRPPGRRWGLGVVVFLIVALLAVLAYAFVPVSIPLTPIGKVHSSRIRPTLQGQASWMMAVAPDSEAFDDYGISPPAQFDFGKANVVISHGQALERLTYTRFSRLVCRYRYWIDRPLGHPWYEGSFVPGDLYLYKTGNKTFVWWGTP